MMFYNSSGAVRADAFRESFVDIPALSSPGFSESFSVCVKPAFCGPSVPCFTVDSSFDRDCFFIPYSNVSADTGTLAALQSAWNSSVLSVPEMFYHSDDVVSAFADFQTPSADFVFADSLGMLELCITVHASAACPAKRTKRPSRVRFARHAVRRILCPRGYQFSVHQFIL